MAETSDPKSLEALHLRLEKIESALEKLGGTRQPQPAASLTEEELTAFRKVRDVVAADFGDFCGINDCFRCVVVRCITSCVSSCVSFCSRPCDVECVCGPCGLGGGISGGLGRFGRMGGGG